MNDDVHTANYNGNNMCDDMQRWDHFQSDFLDW